MIEQNNLLTQTEFLLYRSEDGKIRIETRMENETVWLTQAQMCELFDKNKRTISEHIRNIFSEGELQEEQVVRKFRTTASDGKNYLTEEELDVLNRIVTAYLEFAELQALNRNHMYMRDWIARLDDFLKLSGRDILTNAGKISHEEALEKAYKEYEKYHRQKLAAPTTAEKHFVDAERKIKRLEAGKKGTKQSKNRSPK